MNLSFALFEILAGIFIKSTAILSDAVHDFSDALSLGLAFFLEKKSMKSDDGKYAFGYKRLSVISAIISTGVLAAGTAAVLYNAVGKLFAPNEVRAAGMVYMAFFGIAANLIPVLRMRKSVKISEKAVMLHLLEDLYGWIAVLAVGVLIKFTGWYVLDPVLTLFISAIILISVIKNTVSIYKLIMDAAPDGVDADEIRRSIDSLGGIKVRELRIWSIDGENHAASCVLDADKALSRAQIKDATGRVKALLAENGAHSSFVEVV